MPVKTTGIAHDFNNLLTVILGNLELLERLHPEEVDTARPARTARYIATATDGAKRAAVSSSMRRAMDEKLRQVQKLEAVGQFLPRNGRRPSAPASPPFSKQPVRAATASAFSGKPASCASSVEKQAKRSPTISHREYPLICCAPALQFVTRPAASSHEDR